MAWRTLGDEGVDTGCLAVEERGDGTLLGLRSQRDEERYSVSDVELFLGSTILNEFNLKPN